MKLSERRRKALERHECPEGYEGPCWGPTKADFEAVDQEEQQT